MDTKVIKTDKSPIPAGLIGEGIEVFWCNNEKWVLTQGIRYRYNEAPSHVKSVILRAFQNDRQSLAYMAKIGLKTANEMFDRWYRCVVGGLDHVPDFGNKMFTPDAYNNMCSDSKCPHRGLLCGRTCGIRSWQAETIKAIKDGCTMEKAAEKVNVTHSAVRSRVTKMLEQTGMHTTAQLICWATELGI